MAKNKRTKMIIFSIIGVLILAVAGVFYAIFANEDSTEKAGSNGNFETAKVQQGSLASSTLLSGTITANNEQYVYYEAGKGTVESVEVQAGDEVTVGQVLVQYNAQNLQDNYDKAERALSKIQREINEFNKNYYTQSTVTPTPTETTDEEGMLDTSAASTTPTTSTTATPSLENRASDLNDAYADAQSAVDQAARALNEATVVSKVNGTVVEVNKDISTAPSTTGSQTIVHVVSEGQLQVEGSLSEYDLANLKVDQPVNITTKVYPNKKWTGKISYISNYPKEAPAQAGTTNAAKYPYKVAITGDLGQLKQGFTVTVEVTDKADKTLVPVTAVVSKDGKNYVWIYDNKTKKVKRVDVLLGNADAINQEITKGLTKDQSVISNPTETLKDGMEVNINDSINEVTSNK